MGLVDGGVQKNKKGVDQTICICVCVCLSMHLHLPLNTSMMSNAVGWPLGRRQPAPLQAQRVELAFARVPGLVSGEASPNPFPA